jgi:hypothetical protein
MAITINDIVSENGLIPAINSRLDQIENAINNDLLWRTTEEDLDGNVMSTELDMAENNIINLPEPTEPTHPVRLMDLEEATMPGAYDHGLLTGLEDDDHPQYLTEARADAIYLRDDNGPLTEGGILFADLNGDVAEHADTFFRDPVEGNVSIGHNAPEVPLDVQRRVDQGTGQAIRASAPVISNDEYVSVGLTDYSQDVLDTEIRSVRKSTSSSTVEIHNKILGVKTKVASVTESGGFLVYGALATGDEASPDVDAGGLCLNQGTGDLNILTAKSSDVAHPFTSVVETDTYFRLMKESATLGGATLGGFSEGAGSGLTLVGNTPTPAATFATDPVFKFTANKNTGSTTTSLAATENAFGFYNNTSQLFQIKGNGNQILSGGMATGSEEAPDVDLGGICINHGAADGNALTFKNSDVTHPFTALGETDTYGRILKFSATNGGVLLQGFSESTTPGFGLTGYMQTGNALLSDFGAVNLDGAKSNGTTGSAVIAATENILTVSNRGTVQATVKGNGYIQTRGGLSTGAEESPDVDTGGICINHGAADGFALTFKNSDVAHGMTSIAETDTYGAFGKRDATNGGMLFYGFGEADRAVEFDGFVTTETTGFTTPSAIVMRGATKNGTTVQAMGSTANVATVVNNATLLAAFKGGGNLELLGGIKLSNTGTVLANYEEGTWTPVIADATSGGNVATFTNNAATYTRIGRMVNIRLFASAINTTGLTAGNVLYVRGLPFSSASGVPGVGDARVQNVAFTTPPKAIIQTGATYLNLEQVLTGASATSIFVSAYTSTTASIILNIWYQV